MRESIITVPVNQYKNWIISDYLGLMNMHLTSLSWLIGFSLYNRGLSTDLVVFENDTYKQTLELGYGAARNYEVTGMANDSFIESMSSHPIWSEIHKELAMVIDSFLARSLVNGHTTFISGTMDMHMRLVIKGLAIRNGGGLAEFNWR